MIGDAINKIEELAHDTLGCEIVDLPDHDKYAINHAGKLEFRERPPSPRTHVFGGLWDLVRFAVQRQADSIWHNDWQVVVMFDDVRRIDRAWLNIDATETLTLLRSWPRSYAQHELIWLLRTAMVERVERDLREPVEDINFKKIEELSSNASHGYQKLGVDVEQQAVAKGPIPETFQVALQPWANVCPDFSTEVDCVLGIDLEQKNFRLAIAGDDLAAAMDAAHGELRTRIEELVAEHAGADDRRPDVFRGTP